MLKEILSISGKPGLYLLISQGKNMYIVESLIDHKRMPIYMRDKVVSLGDIAIYTDDGETPLIEVLKKVKEKEGGKEIEFSSSIQPTELRTYLESILPDYDREKVYPSDIKKLMSWYNLLVKSDLVNFEEAVESTEDESDSKSEDAKSSVPEKKEKKAKAPAKDKKQPVAAKAASKPVAGRSTKVRTNAKKG